MVSRSQRPPSEALSWPDIERWVEGGRGLQVELLKERSSTRRIAESLVALANAQGGRLLLCGGLQSQEIGLRDPQAALRKALEALARCEPSLAPPLPQIVSNGHASVVYLAVSPGLHQVYSTAGRYLQRQGALNVPLSSAELTQLLLARGVASYELQAPPDATLDDIDWERVRRYAEHLDLAPDLPLEELLRRRGGLERVTGRPTHAGLLLFGREPERFVRGSEIIVVRYPGARMGDRFVREDVRGPLPEQIGRAEAFVLANMRRDTVLEGLERVELEEYPPAAVREAIVNAVAHRDYAIQGEGIRLLIFSDRLEVYSPGRLPGHVTVDNLLDERYSRNQIIVQVLADLGYIERLGYGIDRMVALMEAEGLPAPTFEETANGFCVTLWGHGQRLARPEPGGQSSRPVAKWQASGLNPRQVSLLEYLDTHDQITNREYQMLCPEVSQETLRRDLAQLVRRGLLLKIGQKRGTYYVLR